ncbi:MAG: hypothetical protein C0593_06870 [Marinilabiliales bacterium]|nr:MAG: hypothetical protein C0593_06870 [Marinilabiliales bacterium]
MERHKLSKSTYIRGLQCTKSLYLHKKRPFLRDKLPPEQRARFTRGHSIGELAHNLFPGGVNMAPKSPSQYPKAVVNTLDEIKKETPVIYEATFQHMKTLVMLDILTRENGKYYGYEVKSSLKISDTYLKDTALQYWVITNSGITLEDFFLITVNPEYKRKEPIVAEDYFIKTSVLEKILPMQEGIEERVTKFIALFDEPHSPRKKIGPQCNTPYPCDFRGLCWKTVPEISVFDLMHLDDNMAFKYYHKEMETPESIKSQPTENPLLQKEIDLVINNTVYVEDLLSEKLRNHQVLFLATAKPAFPLFEDAAPYEETAIAAAFPKGEFIESVVFYNKEEGNTFIRNFMAEHPEVITMEGIPEGISDTENTNILYEKRNLNLFLPELTGKERVDEIIAVMHPEITDAPYSDRFTAATAWQGLISESPEMQDDIIDGLARYAESGATAMMEIIRRLPID